jgi:hypothetical protein
MPETTVDCWRAGETFDLFAGRHDGYAPVIHHRWVFSLKSRFWLVRDVIRGDGRHRLDIHWHFLDERDLVILPPAGHNWSRTIGRWDWSPVYGRKEPAFVLSFSADVPLPAEFAVLLLPLESGVYTGNLMQIAAGAYRYEEARGSHSFFFADAPWSIGGCASDAPFVYRGENADGSENLIVAGGTYLDVDGRRLLAAESPVDRWEYSL